MSGSQMSGIKLISTGMELQATANISVDSTETIIHDKPDTDFFNEIARRVEERILIQTNHADPTGQKFANGLLKTEENRGLIQTLPFQVHKGEITMICEVSVWNKLSRVECYTGGLIFKKSWRKTEFARRYDKMLTEWLALSDAELKEKRAELTKIYAK